MVLFSFRTSKACMYEYDDESQFEKAWGNKIQTYSVKA